MILKKAGVSELENSTTQGRMKPPVGATLKTAHPLANGLVGAWLFNEGTGTTLNDYSGNGNHGTLTGATHLPTWSGVHNGSILFDGIDDYINCPVDSTLRIVGDLTIIVCFSLFVVPIQTMQGLVGFGHTKEYLLQLYSSNPRLLFWHGSTAVGAMIMAGKIDSANRAYVAAVSRSTTDKKIMYFLNGIYIETDSYVVEPVSGTTSFAIGQNSNTNNPFLGLISNVMIYNRVLTPAEIGVLYQYPYCMFY